jgi:carbamoyl-phosphate synthase small subunit
VQFHPEAAAGPHDAGYLFDRFIELMVSGKQQATGPAVRPEPADAALTNRKVTA